MARMLGQPARYVTRQASKKFKRQMIAIALPSYILIFLTGYFSGLYMYEKVLNQFVAFVASASVVLLLVKLTSSIADRFEKERMAFRKGASGEAVVGSVLEGLPDSYRVVHDLRTSYGNIEHVVIGPTGVYAIDSKNWRGTVTADGNGELLLNGRPTRKPEVKNFLRRLTGVRDEIKALGTLDPYLQGVLAFGSAYVDVRWATTGRVHCITEEKLYEYVVENKSRRKLSAREVDSIEQAVLALARTDKGFGVGESERSREAEISRTRSQLGK